MIIVSKTIFDWEEEWDWEEAERRAEKEAKEIIRIEEKFNNIIFSSYSVGEINKLELLAEEMG